MTIERSRGFGLTALLCLLALGNAAVVIVALGGGNSNADTVGMLLLRILVPAAAIVAIVGIWIWYRWAVYAYAALVVINVVIGLATGAPFYSFTMPILLLSVIVRLLKSKWKLFR